MVAISKEPLEDNKVIGPLTGPGSSPVNSNAD
jgi:hypothetical protein